jgi:hypothetical protein
MYVRKGAFTLEHEHERTQANATERTNVNVVRSNANERIRSRSEAFAPRAVLSKKLYVQFKHHSARIALSILMYIW